MKRIFTALAALASLGAAHGQTLPPLQAPPTAWCTLLPAPDGRSWPRTCRTVAQWRDWTATAYLRAEAIGKPPVWTQDNASPYGPAQQRCSVLTMARDKVVQTAQDAEAAYQRALTARKQLEALGQGQ